MKRYERRIGSRKSPKAEADRRYYEKNRDRILAQAKARAERRRLEEMEAAHMSQFGSQEAPTESISEHKNYKKAPSLFKQWIQRLTGTEDSPNDETQRD